MKKILLACSAGMSTSMIVQRMRKIAKEAGKDYKIWAQAVDDILDDEEEFDVALIGPQVVHRLEDVKQIAAEYGKNIPVGVIDKETYGKMKADVILEQAEKLMGL